MVVAEHIRRYWWRSPGAGHAKRQIIDEQTNRRHLLGILRFFFPCRANAMPRFNSKVRSVLGVTTCTGLPDPRPIQAFSCSGKLVTNWSGSETGIPFDAQRLATETAPRETPRSASTLSRFPVGTRVRGLGHRSITPAVRVAPLGRSATALLSVSMHRPHSYRCPQLWSYFSVQQLVEGA
jgi:hypothetical protein